MLSQLELLRFAQIELQTSKLDWVTNDNYKSTPTFLYTPQKSHLTLLKMVQPTAARLMQATRARMFRPGMNNQWGFVMRENRVPHYQRLLQRHDGKRQWWKSPRSPFLLYPFYALMWGSLSASLYGTVRMMFGHKTWY